MEAELLEPESSTGPKKSRFKRDEPPLAAETRGGQKREEESERERDMRRLVSNRKVDTHHQFCR